MRAWKYGSMHSSPRQQMEVRGQIHAPDTLLPEKNHLLFIEYEARWISDPGWTLRRRGKSLALVWNQNIPQYSSPTGSVFCEVRTKHLNVTWIHSLTHGGELFLKSCQLCRTRRLISVFTRVLHWSLSWARAIQSIPSHPITLRSILRNIVHPPTSLSF
jgi:hypothetical protein